MPRPPMKVTEKSKDFKGAIKRLFKSLDSFRFLVVFSLLLAFVSAILSLVAPNKLSDLTDTITLGLNPNFTENTIKDIMNNPENSTEDKTEFMEIMVNADSKEILT